jgi:acyl carrier protein
MDRNEVFEQLQDATVTVLGVDRDAVTEGARFFADLDADSLDLVELVMALEEEFEIEVEESELEGVKTVGQAYDLVKGKLDLKAG